MNRVMLLYPPGKMYQRSEDRAQCNIDDSATATVHACNDLGYAAAVLRNEGYEVFLKDYQTEGKTVDDVKADLLLFKPDAVFISITNATIFSDLEFVNEIRELRDFRVVLNLTAVVFRTLITSLPGECRKRALCYRIFVFFINTTHLTKTASAPPAQTENACHFPAKML